MNPKILLVDDDPSVLKLVSISLKKAGYEVETAGDGVEGYEKANSYKPDLIISDLVMPDMDGIALCKKIREDSFNPMVPFIFMTSLGDEKNEIRGYRAGADEYLVKPVDRKVLLEKVEKLLKRLEKVHPLSEQVKSDAAFQGNLEDLTLAEVIQLLHLNRRKGMLVITDADSGEKGEIYMENGAMKYSSYQNFRGEESINHLVRIKKGTFEFIMDAESPEPNIQGSTMNILMEALRLMDEENADE
jgi:DNA-binding response OmpR family regulator